MSAAELIDRLCATELDLIEVGLRPFHNTGLRKGDDSCWN